MDLTNDGILLEEAVLVLKKNVAEKVAEKQTLKNIFSDEDDSERAAVFVVVTLYKVPEIKPNGTTVPYRIQMAIPNKFVDDQTNILLITKDKPGCKGLRKDHEPSIHKYKDLLRSHDALDIVKDVMPLKQLRTEFRDYEAKRALASRYEVVLCDKNIINRVPLFLGKEFYSKKKIPIAVDLKSKDLRSSLNKAISKVYMFMNMKGNCSMAQVGRLDQTDEEIAQNISSCMVHLRERVPGKWQNVRCIHIKTKFSSSIPLYSSLKSANEVPKCEHPRKKIEVECATDYVDTPLGLKLMHVYADGRIDIPGLTEEEEKKIFSVDFNDEEDKEEEEDEEGKKQEESDEEIEESNSEDEEASEEEIEESNSENEEEEIEDTNKNMKTKRALEESQNVEEKNAKKKNKERFSKDADIDFKSLGVEKRRKKKKQKIDSEKNEVQMGQENLKKVDAKLQKANKNLKQKKGNLKPKETNSKLEKSTSKVNISKLEENSPVIKKRILRNQKKQKV